MFLTTLRLPAALFLVIWFVMQITGIFGDQGSVAWWAHVGGFAAGLVLIKFFETGEHRRRPPPLPVIQGNTLGRVRPRPPFGRGF
jgi:membrane associated rhomboid family serine protease